MKVRVSYFTTGLRVLLLSAFGKNYILSFILNSVFIFLQSKKTTAERARIDSALAQNYDSHSALWNTARNQQHAVNAFVGRYRSAAFNTFRPARSHGACCLGPIQQQSLSQFTCHCSSGSRRPRAGPRSTAGGKSQQCRAGSGRQSAARPAFGQRTNISNRKK